MALSRADILAIGLWSALSFQSPRTEAKIESLRSELLDAGRDLALRSAESSRKRAAVSDYALKMAEHEAEGWAGFDKHFKPEFKRIVGALRSNAALDREELDVLWWVLEDWSELLNRRFSTNSTAASAIASGIEAGRLLRRLPSETHKHLVLRNVLEDATLSMTELLKALEPEAPKLAGAHAENEVLSSCPSIFPLLSRIASNQFRGSASKEKRQLSEWAVRALLESAILRLAAAHSEPIL
jgi:hypothetical protein